MRAGTYPAQVKLPCPLEATEVAIVEPLAQYEMSVAELLVGQEEWQVHVPQVMTPVFDLTIYATFVVILAHLRNFHVGSTI
jgi:hypothetical protein